MTRLLIICAAALGLVAAAAAQAPNTPRPDPRSLRLRGDRFKPLAYDEMTPAQKTMIEHLLSGPRGGANGPFNVLLRSPEMGDLAQQFGASTRFNTSIPKKLNELAIIITARHWTSQFEWTAHHRGALQAGIRPASTSSRSPRKGPPARPPRSSSRFASSANT